jgi:serine/threonine protein kinase
MRYEIGQTLDEIFLIRQVHEGGMALVYVVEDRETGKKAAAKTMRDELLGDSTMVARFRRETKIWVGLGSHPNVVRAFFVKDIDSVPFLFMEYLDGGSLFELIKKVRPIPIEQIISIAAGVAEGMRHVHNRITPDGLRGILHRDLKPANVLLDSSGAIKVTDFGLAGARNATLLTKTYDVFGTFHYSSPEQILDSHTVDRRSDIYSFGAILYHVACSVIPFDADSWSELVKKIKEVIPSEPTSLRSDLPEPISRIIMKCLAKNRDERFDSFDEICEQLSRIDPNAAPGETDTASQGDWTALLDTAQREAGQSGSALVEPIHLLLSAISYQSEPLSSWLKKRRIEEGGIVKNIRVSMDITPGGDAPPDIKFKRSSRRVIGLAQSLAERETATSPTVKHMIKALLQEPGMRDLLNCALRAAGAENDEIEDLFDEIDGLFELSEFE